MIESYKVKLAFKRTQHRRSEQWIYHHGASSHIGGASASVEPLPTLTYTNCINYNYFISTSLRDVSNPFPSSVIRVALPKCYWLPFPRLLPHSRTPNLPGRASFCALPSLVFRFTGTLVLSIRMSKPDWKPVLYPSVTVGGTWVCWIGNDAINDVFRLARYQCKRMKGNYLQISTHVNTSELDIPTVTTSRHDIPFVRCRLGASQIRAWCSLPPSRPSDSLKPVSAPALSTLSRQPIMLRHPIQTLPAPNRSLTPESLDPLTPSCPRDSPE